MMSSLPRRQRQRMQLCHHPPWHLHPHHMACRHHPWACHRHRTACHPRGRGPTCESDRVQVVHGSCLHGLAVCMLACCRPRWSLSHVVRLRTLHAVPQLTHSYRNAQPFCNAGRPMVATHHHTLGGHHRPTACPHLTTGRLGQACPHTWGCHHQAATCHPHTCHPTTCHHMGCPLLACPHTTPCYRHQACRRLRAGGCHPRGRCSPLHRGNIAHPHRSRCSLWREGCLRLHLQRLSQLLSQRISRGWCGRMMSSRSRSGGRRQQSTGHYDRLVGRVQAGLRSVVLGI